MILEIRRINAKQGLFKVFATVKSLTTGRNFHPMKEQTMWEQHTLFGQSYSRCCMDWLPSIDKR